MGLPLAVEAVPENRQVPYLRNKIVVANQKLLQRFKGRLVQVNNPAAPLANEMMVVSLLSVMVAEPIATEVGLGYELQLLHQLQSPIDGRFIDTWIPSFDLAIDISSRDVPLRFMQALQDCHPLWRKLEPLLLQGLKATHFLTFTKLVLPRVILWCTKSISLI